MKSFTCGVGIWLGILAGSVHAQETLTVDGVEVPMSTLLENCQSITGDAAAQIACFNSLSQLIEEQADKGKEGDALVTQTFDALKAVAQHQDDDSGLFIEGAGCKIRIVYYNNYYHLSRRNISSIDLYSAAFDASKLQYDQVAPVPGAPAPLLTGAIGAGATAQMRGGIALESAQYNFAPRTPRASLDDYAKEVVGQLPIREGSAAEFVLVHPKRSGASADILGAFEAFVNACNS